MIRRRTPTVLLAAGGLFAALIILTPPAVAGNQYARVYLTPKIDQPGATLGPASSAAVAGSAQMYPADTGRTITVQRRAAGSYDPWVTVKSGKPASNGYLYFTGWAQFEYRAVLAADGGYPQAMSPVRDYNWATLFSDEFTGASLRPEWSLRGDAYVPGKMEHAKGDLRACQLPGNGALHVRTIDDPGKPPGYYLDCHIGTDNRFEFAYGWAAARVKLHRWRGSHSAFWLQTSPGYVPGSAENDVIETFGSNNPTNPSGNQSFQNVYWDWSPMDGSPRCDPCQSDRNTVNDVEFFGPDGGRWWDTYHVYSVRWTPTQWMFYIDGRKIYTTTDGVPSNQAYLVLSMLTRDYEVGDHEGRELSTYQMIVDWVQVWKQTP